jgi:hypothetical protein
VGSLTAARSGVTGRVRHRLATDRRLLDIILLAAFVGGSVPFWVSLVPAAAGDAVLYRQGVVSWLAGSDPWLAGDPISRFAGTPLTLIAFAPSALVDAGLWAVVAAIGSMAAALFAVRHLRIPIAWLFFPPVTAGIWTANPSVLMLALAVAALPAGRSPLGQVLGALATWVKVLVILPLAVERQWRALALAGVASGLTVIVLPGLWSRYVTELPAISATLAANTHYSSAWYQAPWLLPPAAVALVALARIDRRAAGWLAIPALAPVVEYHWAVLMLPVAHPVLGLAAFVPDAAWPAVITAYVIVRYRARRGARPSEAGT